MQNRNFMLEGVVHFFYLLKIFWKYSTYKIILMWQNSIYHPTNYEITNSIFSILTFNLMNEQMHISVSYQFNTQHLNFKADLNTNLFYKLILGF